MSQLRNRRSRSLLGLAILVASVAPAAFAQEPVYQQLLRLPGARDSLAFTGSVTADLVTGEVLVTDVRNNRILIFDSKGIFRFQISGGDVFTAPLEVAVDPQGFLLVIASHRGRRSLLELDFDGLFLGEIELTSIPEGWPEPRFDSIALSPSGERVYVLDRRNLLLWVVDRTGEVQAVTDLAEGLSEGDRDDFILRHVDAYADTVLIPFARTGHVGLFEPDGKPRLRVGIKGTGPCQLGLPTAAVLDADGNLVIVDQQRSMIVRWSVAENRCLGEYYGLGAAPGYLYYPSDIALDAQGRLYVSQGYEGRVQTYEGVRPAAGWDRVEPSSLPEGLAPSEPKEDPPGESRLH